MLIGGKYKIIAITTKLFILFSIIDIFKF